MTPYKHLLDSLPITTDRAKNLKISENKSEEEPFDILEDEQIPDFDDHDKNNADLQDGAGFPRCSNNNNQTPASARDISLLSSAIQLLTKSPTLNSSLAEEKQHEKGKGKGKRPPSCTANAVPARKARATDDKESGAKNSMSASANSNDRQALHNSVLNSRDDKSEHETTGSGDEDELLSQLVKEYKSNDTVGASLKSEQLAKLVNKMFRCKLSEKNLKDRLDRQERPANCEAAKPPKVNPGIWRRLRDFSKKRDLQFYKIQQALIKGILPVARIADKLMTAKSANTEECQEMKKLGLEAMSLLTHSSYQINMQRQLFLKPDIGREYSPLCSSQLPFTELLFGDDLQKHLKDISDHNKIGAKITPAHKGTCPYAGKSHSGYNNYKQPKNLKGPRQRPWKHKGQGN